MPIEPRRVLVFRPSLLKGVESWADRYYSTRRSTESLDVMRYQPDDFVRSRPRIVGAVVQAGARRLPMHAPSRLTTSRGRAGRR